MNYDIERTTAQMAVKGHLPCLVQQLGDTLPADLKCIGNILSFKRNLKTHLFSIAYACKH